MGVHLELRNDAKYAIKRVGTISIQLMSDSSLEVKDVLYVLGPDHGRQIFFPWSSKKGKHLLE